MVLVKGLEVASLSLPSPVPPAWEHPAVAPCSGGHSRCHFGSQRQAFNRLRSCLCHDREEVLLFIK